MPKDFERNAAGALTAATVDLRRQRKEQVSAIYVPRPETADIRAAIDRVREWRLVSREASCLLLTGRAGVGKSEILTRYHGD